MKSLPLARLFSLTVMGLALGMVSATLEPALLGYKILELTPDRPSTVLGFTTFVGLVVATLTQPLMGAFSDHTHSPWGRRLPYLAGGAAVLIASLIWIAAAPNLASLLMGVVFLQVASNTAQGPWQALLPDYVPDRQLGSASVLKLLCEGAAAVLGRLVAGQLIALTPVWGRAAMGAAIAVPSLSLIVGVAITARGVGGLSSDNSLAPPRAFRAAISQTFSVDLRAYPAFGWWFLNRLFFWCAMIAVSIFVLFYAIDVVGATQADAQRLVGQAAAVLGGGLLLGAIPVRRLVDQQPRRGLVLSSGVIAGVGTCMVLATRDYAGLALGGAVIGAGVGLYMVSSWALIAEIVPPAQAARYLGIANMATAMGSAVARLVGGALIDGVNAAQGSKTSGYLILYAMAAALFFLSAFLVIPLRLSHDR